MQCERTLRAKDLAFLAGKKRQSPQTGLVHFSNGHTIPLYENFCFVLSLLYQKKTELILEAKEILFRLLHFQVDNFPVYVHEFPRCYDIYLGLKIAPLLLKIQSFHSVLGESVQQKIDETLIKLFSFYEGKEFPPLWSYRLAVCLFIAQKDSDRPQEIDTDRFLAADWWEYWISLQFLQTPVCPFYHVGLQMALGFQRQQDRFDPAPLMIDWISPNEYFPHLMLDRSTHLHLIALDQVEIASPLNSDFIQYGCDIYWKGPSGIHSLVGENILHGKSILPTSFEIGRDDLFEVAYYCDASSDIELWIDGKKGTVFNFGQTIRINSSTKQFSLIFELVEGEGEFCGHIFRSNRPNQIATKESYEAFDWKIGLRTLRRSPNCVIRSLLKQEV